MDLTLFSNNVAPPRSSSPSNSSSTVDVHKESPRKRPRIIPATAMTKNANMLCVHRPLRRTWRSSEQLFYCLLIPAEVYYLIATDSAATRPQCQPQKCSHAQISNSFAWHDFNGFGWQTMWEILEELNHQIQHGSKTSTSSTQRSWNLASTMCS